MLPQAVGYSAASVRPAPNRADRVAGHRTPRIGDLAAPIQLASRLTTRADSAGIPYQNDGKGCSAIVGKVEKA